MQVINIIGAPGTGKSTIAAMLFAKMKIAGYKCELVTEYAKDMVYENRSNILGDQVYILAKQNRRLTRLIDQGLDFAITDSPILLGCIYNRSFVNLEPLIKELFDHMDNEVFKIQRVARYQTYGRYHSEVESDIISDQIDDLLRDFGISYHNIIGDEQAADNIMKILGLSGACGSRTH